MDLLAACCNCREVWEEVLVSIQQALLVVRSQGTIVFGSPIVQKFFGYSNEELTGKELSTLFTPEDSGILYPNLLSMIERNEFFEDELMLVRKDGSRFVAFLVLRPCYDPESRQSIAIISIQDIDKQKKIERAFRTSHYEDLIKIANGIAHELRNPLVGIGGFVNRLYKKCEVAHSHPEYYTHIMTNLRKIETLVKKVELFASLPRPNLADQTMTELVSEAIQTYSGRIEERKIELSLNIESCALKLDGGMVTRAVSILLENALDATPEGGSIKIESKISNNRYILSVEDNGTGIEPEDLPYIFNPFFSTKPSGAGIDLALAKRIAEGHGGQIAVESALGRGSVFILEFPIERRRQIRRERLESELS